jgi:release factor glutamine methyltransferase
VSDLRALLHDAAQRLAAAGVDNPRLDARLLWQHAQSFHPSLEGGSKFAETPSGSVGARANFGEGYAVERTTRPLPEKSSLRSDLSTLPQGEGGILERFDTFLTRRIARESLAYITGRKEFWSLDFEVGPGVLIPRPDTETIIEQALLLLPDKAAPLRVLDLGTGSGCLLAAFLKEFPNARGLGIDSSEKAIATATRNIARHGLASRAEIRSGDWGEGLDGPFDVILSNPPYIKSCDLAGLAPEVIRYEPVQALDGGADGLASIRALGAAMKRLLAGLAFIEIGAGQAAEASAILTACGLVPLKTAPDLAGIPRILVTAAAH